MGTPFSFGAYVYGSPTGGATTSQSWITDYPTEITSRLRTADAPGSIDSFTDGGLPAPRHFSVKGTLKANDGDDIEDLWDDFLLAHDAGIPQALYLQAEDRYILAEVESVQDVEAANNIGARRWQVNFVCQRPYWWLDTVVTQAGTVAGDGLSATIALVVGGNRPARAVLTITLAAIGSIASGHTYPATTSKLTITNTTTGATATVLWARSTAENIVFDCAEENITQNGADANAIFLSGPWLNLTPGVTNNLSITASGGAQITSCSASCQGRIR